MSSRTRSSSGISENSIVFFEGGHNHNGVSSSLIDTEQYSIYDFIVGKTGSNSRQIRQQRNFDNLKTVVSNIVINDVLGPSGVRLLPNSVQSVHIQAGAITANELAANIVLVNNVISSNNYVLNTSGWAIYSNGTAEFDAASIRGTLTAGAVVINNNNYWYSNGLFRVGSNSEFMSFNGSDLSVTGDVTTGNLTATGGTIGQLVINNGQLRYTDNVNDTGLMLGPRSFPVNDGSPALVISSSFASGSYTSVRAVGIDMTGNIDCNAVASEFLSVTNTISGSINGNAATADDADALAGYSANFNDVANTVPIRGADASISAGYLIMTGGATIGASTGDAVRKRSDGYLLTVSSRREIKNSIEDISSDFAYSIINALQPVSFRFNEQQYIGDLFSEREAEYREYGFIAQDVGEVNSNLVSYSVNAEGDGIQPSMWSDFALISLSVSAIKGLIFEISELKSKLSELESYLFNGPNNEV